MRIPETQYAVQLTAPDKLILNKSKKIIPPGKHQILAKVEAVGLCFSDLKLLKQFSSHVRKSEVIAGIEPEILKHISSYVPGDAPTVPGHEAVVTIQQIGEDVKNFEPGERYLVQADYRPLRTEQSNAAFGYNFEGALQQYVLFDERIITSPQGESFLIPVPKHLSASAVALVEPWACVEDAYSCVQRRSLKENGKLLIAPETNIDQTAITNFLKSAPNPSEITWLGDLIPPPQLDVKKSADISLAADSFYDDIIYLGHRPRTIEQLFAKLAPHGLFNIVLCGGRLDRDIITPVGKVHYGGIRIIGTPGFDPTDSISYIPATAEIRPHDNINIVGAAGPMGLMHVVRNICLGTKGVSLFAGDVDNKRMAALTKIAAPLAKKNNVTYQPYNPAKNSIDRNFDYTVIMVPAAELVVCGLENAPEGIAAVENRSIAGKIIVYPSCRNLPLMTLKTLAKNHPEIAGSLDNGLWTLEAEKLLLEKYKDL